MVRYIITFPDAHQDTIAGLAKEMEKRLNTLDTSDPKRHTFMMLGYDKPYTVTDIENSTIYYVDGEDSKIIKEYQ